MQIALQRETLECVDAGRCIRENVGYYEQRKHARIFTSDPPTSGDEEIKRLDEPRCTRVYIYTREKDPRKSGGQFSGRSPPSQAETRAAAAVIIN